MAGARSALIVATNVYDDERLARLDAPARDAEELADVLGDPGIGGFEVTTVLDRPAHEVTRAVAQFFRDRRPDDLVLLHLSCHGLKDDSGELYFAATDTSLDLLEATALASSSVNRVIERSRAGRVLVFLDCCYSGAFARGMTPRAGGTVNVDEQLGGRGRAVITASSAMQYAFEGGSAADGGTRTDSPSLFTRALVDGLRSGEADRDLDGWVSLDELYAFVHDEVTEANPDQTPRKWAFDIEGDLRVARRGAPVTTPAELSAELRESLGSPLSWERVGVVEPLAEVLAGDHPGRALAARRALEELAARDDSERVRAAAREALAGTAPQTARIPVPVEPSVPAPPPLRARSRRTTWVAGAAALVVVAALGGWLATRGGDGGGDGGRDDTGDDSTITAVPVDEVLTVQQVGSAFRIARVDPAGKVAPVGTEGEVTALSMPSLDAARDAFVYLSGTDRAPRLVRMPGGDARDDAMFAGDGPCPGAGMSRMSWSPDGSSVAFVCKGDGLYRMSVPDGVPERVLPSPSIVGGPTWGGDGRIYLLQDQAEHAARIFSVDADGADRADGPLVASSKTDVDQRSINWGPPGLLYVAAPNDQGNPPVREGMGIKLRLPGASTSLALRDVVPEHVAWSPDHRSILWAVRTHPDSRTDLTDQWWTADVVDGPDGPALADESEDTRIDVSGAVGSLSWGRR